MFVQETSLYAAALAIKAAVINVCAELQWNENQLENLSLRKLALICKLHKNGKMEGVWYFIGIVCEIIIILLNLLCFMLLITCIERKIYIATA